MSAIQKVDKVGAEFLVNTTTQDGQVQSSVAALSNGGFVVTWRDESATGGDTSGTAVRGQMFASDGSKLGGEFLVNTTTTGDQFQPSVAPLSDGGFVVTWSDESATGVDTSGAAVRGQVFLADGGKSGGEFLVNTTTLNWQHAPSVASLSDGGFVVTWTDQSSTGGDTSGTAVRGQVFLADGSKSGGEILINNTTSGNQFEPSVASLSNGGFVVTWTDNSQTGGDTSDRAVRGQVFQADCSKSGGEFLVNTTTPGHQWAPSVVSLSNGGFVVTWSDMSQTGGDTSDRAVRGQVFADNGSKSGSEFLVNTTTSGNQFEPSVASLSDGGFVVTWRDESATGDDTSGYAVRGQAFASDGIKSGGEFLVNTTTSGNQLEPSVASLSDGGFVVTWTDWSVTGDDTSGAAVRGQVFIHSENLFIGSAGDDTITGTAGDDTIRGGDGADTLTGGGGNDDFVGTAAALAGDTITDFAVGDRIVVEGLDLSALNGQAAAGTIDLGGGQTLTLSGVTGASGSFAASFSSGNTVVTLVAPPSGGDGGGGGGGGSGSGGSATTTVTVPAPSGDEGAPTQIASTTTLTPPQGVSVSAEGPSSPQSTSTAATEVTARVNAVVSSPADQALIQSNLNGFLGGRAAGTLIEIRTITPSAEAGATPGGPIVITGSGGVGAGTEEAFVIDARGLPAGSVIQLDNVEFAVIVGEVTVIGGAGANYVIGDAGNQTIVLGEDDDTLFGGAGDDSIGSAGGSDWIYGGEGRDTVFGGTGQDFVYGNQGDDVVYGNQGDDFLYGGQGADTLYGGQDADIAYGNLGDDVVYGNLGSDVLYGGRGNDALYGGRGADTLYGGVGDDVLCGGEGDDWLFGGAGADRFVVAAGGGFDVIGDFNGAEGDQVLIQANIAGNGVDSFSALLARASNNAVGDVDIELAAGQIIRLVGVRTEDLSAEMFGFF